MNNSMIARVSRAYSHDLKTTARVIVTKRCVRKCPYCVNNHPEIKAQMEPLQDVEQLERFQTVCLTGGEPFLAPKATLRLIKELRAQNPTQKIYVYASIFEMTKEQLRILALVDGLHYTIHQHPTSDDQEMLDTLQLILMGYRKRGKSFRLALSPDIFSSIRIMPSAWNDIRVKEWLDDCPLPENEELFIAKITTGMKGKR